MTEKEKMLAGLPYISYGEELSSERLKAKTFLFKYNNTSPKYEKRKRKMLDGFLGSTNGYCHFESPFYCDYGYNIHVGKNFYANHGLIILDCALVTIGNDVMFGPNVQIYTAGHPLHYEPRIKDIEFAKPVVIGNNVWIGGNVTVNPGVTIGDNSVIGSGAVLTKDIPADCIAVGNPCRVLRTLNEDDKKYFFKKELINNDEKEY